MLRVCILYHGMASVGLQGLASLVIASAAKPSRGHQSHLAMTLDLTC